jgi:hypothetical protein
MVGVVLCWATGAGMGLGPHGHKIDAVGHTVRDQHYQGTSINHHQDITLCQASNGG